MSRGTLQGWRRNGFFDPQNPPRYTANEIKALKKIKVLIDHGAPFRPLQRVGRSLCEQRGHGSNAEAFLKTDLVCQDGDIRETLNDGTYISWLYQPGQPTSQRPDSLAVVGDSYIQNVLTQDVRRRRLKERIRKMYARDLRTHVFCSLGHLPIAEVEPHLRSWAIAKNDDGHQPTTIERWLAHIHGIGEHARDLGLYDGPSLSKFVPGLRQHSNEQQTHGPKVIREFARRVKTPFNISYLLGALNGFRPRERAPLLWENFLEDPPTLQVRWELVKGEIKRVPDSRIDDRPISRSIAALLSAWRDFPTPFKGDNDYIFASKTGERPVPTSDIYLKYLDPVADDLKVLRPSVYRLHKIAISQTGRRGLTKEQQTEVLRLHDRRGAVGYYPTEGDIQHTRQVLDRIDEEIFGATMDGEIFGPKLAGCRAPWAQATAKEKPPNVERPAGTGTDDATADPKREPEASDGFSVEQFKQARANAGHSQKAAARELGIARNQVSRIERGLVSAPHLATVRVIREYIEDHPTPGGRGRGLATKSD